VEGLYERHVVIAKYLPPRGDQQWAYNLAPGSMRISGTFPSHGDGPRSQLVAGSPIPLARGRFCSETALS
jgi:hypothetical protein